ncbi:hypothetical protein [uncultured Agrococcus sp.]|uniref:hypothetical protein n=1 Tax=uncultured Agrococcus sp. TaxID=382258 RepID=UPI0025FB55D9|nr:hypothetical protein [uncultured Agrococcus sp.]
MSSEPQKLSGGSVLALRLIPLVIGLTAVCAATVPAFIVYTLHANDSTATPTVLSVAMTLATALVFVVGLVLGRSAVGRSAVATSHGLVLRLLSSALFGGLAFGSFVVVPIAFLSGVRVPVWALIVTLLLALVFAVLSVVLQLRRARAFRSGSRPLRIDEHAQSGTVLDRKTAAVSSSGPIVHLVTVQFVDHQGLQRFTRAMLPGSLTVSVGSAVWVIVDAHRTDRPTAITSNP